MIRIILGFLIVGGDAVFDGPQAEVFLPGLTCSVVNQNQIHTRWTVASTRPSSAVVSLAGLTCSVGDMSEGRSSSSLCHGLVCGGWGGKDGSR